MTDRPPWYRRPLLPQWFPTWLAVTLLIGIGFGVCFGVFLETPNPIYTGLAATAAGLLLAVLVLSMASFQYRGPGPNTIAPPDWLRYPVFTAAVLTGPLIWVADASVDVRGGVFASGLVAELLGLVLILIVVLLITLGLATQRCRLGRIRSAGVLSLVVSLIALLTAVSLFIIHRVK